MLLLHHKTLPFLLIEVFSFLLRFLLLRLICEWVILVGWFVYFRLFEELMNILSFSTNFDSHVVHFLLYLRNWCSMYLWIKEGSSSSVQLTPVLYGPVIYPKHKNFQNLLVAFKGSLGCDFDHSKFLLGWSFAFRFVDIFIQRQHFFLVVCHIHIIFSKTFWFIFMEAKNY